MDKNQRVYEIGDFRERGMNLEGFVKTGNRRRESKICFFDEERTWKAIDKRIQRRLQEGEIAITYGFSAVSCLGIFQEFSCSYDTYKKE